MNDSYRAFLNRNEHLYWKGFTAKDRNSVISEIEKVANQYGFITDFHMFSDMEITIKIEIEEQNIYSLYADLRNHITLNDCRDLHSESKEERSIFLHVTFLKSTGNLRIEVPAVPG